MIIWYIHLPSCHPLHQSVLRPCSLRTLCSPNILVMIRSNSPHQAQPPDTSQISQALFPSQIHVLLPRAHGQSHLQGAEP